MAIAIGVHATAGGHNATTTDTSATPVATTASGSTFVICVSYSFANTIASIGDNKSNTYTLIASQNESSSALKAAMYYCANGTGGSGHYAQITFNEAADAEASIHFIEITGAATASYDTYAANADTGVSPSSITSPTLAQANELLISFFSCWTAGDYSSTPDGTFTELDEQISYYVAGSSTTAYRIVSSTSAVTSTWTNAVGAGPYANALIIAAFKEGGGGGGSGPAIGGRYLIGNWVR